MNGKSSLFTKVLGKGTLICSVSTVVSLFFWFLSVIQAKAADFSALSNLGLFSILPFTFFIAFGLIVFSFFFTIKLGNKRQLFLLIIQTLLLILFINLTPALIEGTPRFTAGYSNYVSVNYIEQLTKIDSSTLWVHNWPSFSIFFDALSQVSLIPWDFVLLVYPTIFNVMLLPALYLLFSASSEKSSVVWLAIWFVFLGNWVGQDYFSIQSMGFLFITFLLFLFFRNFEKSMTGREWFALFFVLFFYLVTSHLLSSLIIVSICFVLLVFKQTYRKPLFFLLFFTVIGWTVINATAYLSGNLSRILSQVLNFSAILQGNLSNRLISGSPTHMLAAEIRVIYSFVIVLIAVTGIIFAWRSKTLNLYGKRMLYVLVGISLLIFAFAYGGELYMRIYMLSLIPLSYFAAKFLLKYKKAFFVSLAFFSIIAPSMILIAHYGNEITCYVPRSELTGVNFLYETTTNGRIYGGSQFQGGDFRDAHYHSNFTYYSFREMHNHNSSSYLWETPRENYVNRYVCVSFATYSYFAFIYGYPEFPDEIQSNITECVSYNKLYDNPSFSVYNSAPVTNS